MTTLVRSQPLLDVAGILLRERPRSAAFRRRAISTAYYAVFHALARVLAETFAPGVSTSADEYVRIYRALDHGPLRQAFIQNPLRAHDRLRLIGDAVVLLQSQRHMADYHPPKAGLLPEAEVRVSLELARQTVESIFALDLPDRRLLATCLLFKTC